MRPQLYNNVTQRACELYVQLHLLLLSSPSSLPKLCLQHMQCFSSADTDMDQAKPAAHCNLGREELRRGANGARSRRGILPRVSTVVRSVSPIAARDGCARFCAQQSLISPPYPQYPIRNIQFRNADNYHLGLGIESRLGLLRARSSTITPLLQPNTAK